MVILKLFVFFSVFFMTCLPNPDRSGSNQETPSTQPQTNIVVGAENTDEYLPSLLGKKVGIVGNQTSLVRDQHLVDFLIDQGVDVQRIFSPEHGFRGDADAGAKVQDGIDPASGLPVISLYGKNRQPSRDQLQGLDVMIFDMQDVGVRYYTYISTLHYVMEACAAHGTPLMVLDRPNPNGHYVDGPILDTAYRSFVGMHPVPIVHGMTIGEYAQMINGESWLSQGGQVELTVIPCLNYTHSRPYSLPIKPSPNLPNDRSIYLYPALCLFEGTVMSVGRGTDKQFQVYGHPDFPKGDTTFVPMPMAGARHPKLEGQACNGWDLSRISSEKIRQTSKIELAYVLDAYALFPNKEQFFLENRFFDKLAGGTILRKQIEGGMQEAEIRASWKDDLAIFNVTRKKYLLY